MNNIDKRESMSDNPFSVGNVLMVLLLSAGAVLWLIYEIITYGIKWVLVTLGFFDFDEDDNLVSKKKNREKREREELQRKVKSGEISLENYPHVTPPVERGFLFKEEDKFPYDKLILVEAEPCPALHRFMEDNAEWLRKWCEWYGFDIITVNPDEIRRKMLFPQDFHVFRHGLLWYSASSSGEHEYGLSGDIHYYFDLDPDSEVPLQDQFDDLIEKVYRRSLIMW